MTDPRCSPNHAVAPSTVALLPCPFCGSPGAICEWENKSGFWVNCSCGVETNESRTEAEAIIAWNTRAPATLTDGDVQPVAHYTDLTRELLQASDEYDRGHGPLHALAANAILDLESRLQRISAVTASNEQRGNDLVTVIAQRDAAEAWLAEAVEALRHSDIDLSMILPHVADDDMRKSIRKTLGLIDDVRKPLNAPVGETPVRDERS